MLLLQKPVHLQAAFFSATLPDTVSSFAGPWLEHKPVTLKLGAMNHAQSFANSMRSYRSSGVDNGSSDVVPGSLGGTRNVPGGSNDERELVPGRPAAKGVVVKKLDSAPGDDDIAESLLLTSEPAGAATTLVRTAVQSSLAVSRRVEQAVSVCANHKKPRRALKWLTAARSSSGSSGTSSNSADSSDSSSADVSSNGGAASSAVVPVLVFCNTISAVGIVSKMLAKHYAYVSNSNSSGGKGAGGADGEGQVQGSYSSSGVRALHGNMPQKEREAALRAFVQGSNSNSSGGGGSRKCHTLVATDVAARGLHMPKLRHVLNYDFPPSLEQVNRRVSPYSVCFLFVLLLACSLL